MCSKSVKILIIIPARGGSKGIPRKNLRPLNEKPLIWYSISVAKNSIYNPDIVVSTDDVEIEEIARLFGSAVIKRPEALSFDNVTLDPVIYHAVVEMENKKQIKYDLVITLQPTSPLLKAKTLDTAVDFALNSSYDTIISAEEFPHLCWEKKDKIFIPIYKSRQNRQFLKPLYKENGAFMISTRENVTKTSRIGNRIYLFRISTEESIDINSYNDWWVAENLFNRLNIVFRVDGSVGIGLGHIYRALTLANRIGLRHNIVFLMDKQKALGISKVKEFNYSIIEFAHQDDIFRAIEEFSADIVINDILDTKEQYIRWLKKKNYFVVNFEDMGEGSRLADLVINALYENSNPAPNHYYGYKYVCLRDDFTLYRKKIVEEKVKKVLMVFGGTDPNNLVGKALRAVKKSNLKHIFFKVILGMGYSFEEELTNYINILKKDGFKLYVEKNVKTMAKEMSDSDIIITSNGRTIYEATSLGVPCISISQNERESKHLFVHYSNAVEYLGMAQNVSEEKIADTLKRLINNFALRKKMHEKFLSFELEKGTERVINLILNKKNYEKKNIHKRYRNF